MRKVVLGIDNRIFFPVGNRPLDEEADLSCPSEFAGVTTRHQRAAHQTLNHAERTVSSGTNGDPGAIRRRDPSFGGSKGNVMSQLIFITIFVGRRTR